MHTTREATPYFVGWDYRGTVKREQSGAITLLCSYEGVTSLRDSPDWFHQIPSIHTNTLEDVLTYIRDNEWKGVTHYIGSVIPALVALYRDPESSVDSLLQSI